MFLRNVGTTYQTSRCSNLEGSNMTRICTETTAECPKSRITEIVNTLIVIIFTCVEFYLQQMTAL
jgi:hypothetical protein